MVLIEVIELLSQTDKSDYLKQLKECDWEAAKFLVYLIENEKLEQLCGVNPKLFLLINDSQIISFCTFVFQDDVKDETLFPWIGFVYTYPKYRGNRYFGLLLDHITNLAISLEYNKLYISTNESGLYEKYGFSYYKNMLDINGDDSRIYYKNI